MKRTISTTIDDRYHVEAKNRGIRWSEALRFGIIKLAQLEDGEDLAGVNTRINEQQLEIKRLHKNISLLQGRLLEKKK